MGYAICLAVGFIAGFGIHRAMVQDDLTHLWAHVHMLDDEVFGPPFGDLSDDDMRILEEGEG